jgi:hypothetical protein
LFLTHGLAERQYATETVTKLKDCFSALILWLSSVAPSFPRTGIDIASYIASPVSPKDIGLAEQVTVTDATAVN